MGLEPSPAQHLLFSLFGLAQLSPYKLGWTRPAQPVTARASGRAVAITLASGNARFAQ